MSEVPLKVDVFKTPGIKGSYPKKYYKKMPCHVDLPKAKRRWCRKSMSVRMHRKEGRGLPVVVLMLEVVVCLRLLPVQGSGFRVQG